MDLPAPGLLPINHFRHNGQKLTKILREHREWVLSNGGKGSRADLSGADLNHAELKGVNLVRADMRGIHLWRAWLIGADLREADLSKSDLCGTNLTAATQRSRLTGC